MCGLVGALACGEFEEKRMEKIRQEAMIFLTTELLQLTQTRGKDATGIATMFSDCDYMGLKMGISAQEFISRFGNTEEDYEGYLKIWRKKSRPAKISIGHCRKPSVGGSAGPEDNKNNHPIKIGDIIGVHNGTLINHDKIFSNLNCKRDGNVDSEAIFRLLHHYTNNGTEPFTIQSIQETCKRISGSYAVLSFSGNNPFQLAAFRDGRPIEVAIIKPIKLALISSEKDFLKMAIFRYNKMANLYQTGAFKFIPLKKDDIEIESLPDDSLFLFDVRKEITPETKVKDLYISDKIPRTDKIWVKTKAVSTTAITSTTSAFASTLPEIRNNLNYGAYNNNAVKKTEVLASTTLKTNALTVVGPQYVPQLTPITTSLESINPRSCMAWNKSSAQYESVAGLDRTKKHGNIEMDCDNGSFIDVSLNPCVDNGMTDCDIKNKYGYNLLSIGNTVSFSLDESSTPIDNLISDPAKITEIIVADVVDDNPIIAAYKHDKVDNFLAPIKKIDINLDTHPDVLEAAVKITQDQPNFSNDTELAHALEIINEDAIKCMETYSLANRIKSFFFKRGWYSGYVARLNEEKCFDENKGTRELLVRSQTKQKSAQDTIRSMKSVTNVFWNMLKQFPEVTISDYNVEKAVSNVFEVGKEMKSDVVSKVFKPGDIREIPILSKIMASIVSNEHK